MSETLKIPRKYTDLTVEQYLNWQLLMSQKAVDEIEPSEIEQVEALTGIPYLGNESIYLESWRDLPSNWLSDLFKDIGAHYDYTNSTTLVLSEDRTVIINHGFDLFNGAFGANQQILETVDQINNAVYSESINADMLERIKDKDTDELSEDELSEVTRFNNMLLIETLRQVPNLYAYAVMSSAKMPVTEANVEIVKKVILEAKAYQFLPTMDAFFLGQMFRRWFPSTHYSLFAFSYRLMTWYSESANSMLIRKILYRAQGLSF